MRPSEPFSQSPEKKLLLEQLFHTTKFEHEFFLKFFAVRKSENLRQL